MNCNDVFRVSRVEIFMCVMNPAGFLSFCSTNSSPHMWIIDSDPDIGRYGILLLILASAVILFPSSGKLETKVVLLLSVIRNC
jgi:hypothetical protein